MHRTINRIVLLTSILFYTCQLWAKDEPKYPASLIPVGMTDNANAVFRNDQTFVEIISPSKIIVKRSYAITILKESAISYSILNILYNKFQKLSDITVTIYKASGEKEKRIKNEDILDLSAIDGNTVYSDNRRKYIDPKYQTYPFTVEVEYTTTYSSAFFLPSWSVFKGYNISVEQAGFIIDYPTTYELRYIENRIDPGKRSILIPEKKRIEWFISNFKARNPEPFSPNEEDSYPGVTVSPVNFEIENYSGNLNNWKDFGIFISELNKGKDNLPQETRIKMNELVKDCKNDYEKIKIIYEYAQKKNRYISVQVGIGGWQPIDAETVDRLSYGDCKALSNYTKSMLEAVGIKANYVLVGAGDHAPVITPEFSRNAFNHVIVCVPLKQDSIWLECTNSFFPAGYLGSFTDDRYVLIIEGENSRLVRTPIFSLNDNVINTSGEVILTPDGNATASYSQSYCGAFYGDYLRLKQITEKDRFDAIVQQIKIPSFKIVNYSIQDNETRKPSLQLNLKLDLTNNATIMGNRLILKLSQFNSVTDVPRFVRKRESNLEIRRNKVENDTVTYQIPDGFRVEAMPAPAEIKTDFGHYRCNAVLKDRSIQLVRQLQIYKTNAMPARYNEFRDFLEKVAALDNAKCVLIKE
jgi:transglutaminase-like putative cysteine protease